MATSALAVVMRWPGRRLDRWRRAGTGRGRRPTGTMCIRSAGTLWSRWMSVNEFSDTVMTRRSRWATSVCMLVKAYQRRERQPLVAASRRAPSRGGGRP